MTRTEMMIHALPNMSCGIYAYDVGGTMGPIRPAANADGWEFVNAARHINPGRWSVLIIGPSEQAVRDLARKFDEHAPDRGGELWIVAGFSSEALSFVEEGNYIQIPSGSE